MFTTAELRWFDRGTIPDEISHSILLGFWLKSGKLNVTPWNSSWSCLQLLEFSFICPVIESAAVLKAIETVISADVIA